MPSGSVVGSKYKIQPAFQFILFTEGAVEREEEVAKNALIPR